MKKTGAVTRRLALLAACLLLAVLSLSGCGQKETELNVQEAASKLLETVTFQDTLTLLPETRFTTLYNVEEADLKAQAVYISSGATAEEIAVMEAADADAAKRVKAAAERRIAEQKEGFEDYVPAELTKLNNPVLELSGRYVLLCICDQPEQARDTIKKLLA
ncbi:MAG: DUF4358 domain-containing protein [Clostridiales bacterium]|nr:DUF4358 domain-containing protein [Clostridiales bacterium]